MYKCSGEINQDAIKPLIDFMASEKVEIKADATKFKRELMKPTQGWVIDKNGNWYGIKNTDGSLSPIPLEKK